MIKGPFQTVGMAGITLPPISITYGKVTGSYRTHNFSGGSFVEKVSKDRINPPGFASASLQKQFDEMQYLLTAVYPNEVQTQRYC